LSFEGGENLCFSIDNAAPANQLRKCRDVAAAVAASVAASVAVANK